MYELYQESMAMAISLGKTFSMPVPTIFNSGYFGIQLKSLLDSNSGYIGMVAIC
jgi:DNA-binding XRE family transcriptional regulator